MTKYTEAELLELTPQEYRSMVSKGEWTGKTYRVCRGYAVTDVVIIPRNMLMIISYSAIETPEPYP